MYDSVRVEENYLEPIDDKSTVRSTAVQYGETVYS